MKRMIAMAATAALLATPANAADIYQGGPPSTDEYSSPLFTGLSVGIHGGAQFDSIDVEHEYKSIDGFSTDGLVGGVGVEYLRAAGPFRYGLYGDLGISNVALEVDDDNVFEHDWSWGGGLIAGGMLYDYSMVYLKAGYKVGYGTFDNDDVDYGAWDFRLGLQTMATRNISIGTEIQYLSYDDVELGGEGASQFDDSEGLAGMVRLNWWPQL